MSKTASASRNGQSVTAYMTVKGAAKALDFYARAFGAVELYRLAEPGGRIGHAEIRIGNSVVKLADEYPDYGALAPTTLGGSPIRLHVYVEDVDVFVEKAVAAGAELVRPVADQFYGDRSGMIKDPFGHSWLIATHKEDVSPEEMQKRFNAMMR